MVKSVAVITISDTCSREPHKDASGPALAELVQQAFPKADIHTKIIPDEYDVIKSILSLFSQQNHFDIILTTGGTGFSPRDVTPEATKAVITKEAPAITTALTIASLKKTSMAMISRAVAGINNKTLIINFPGSKKAVVECFEVIRPVLSHAVDVIKDEKEEVKTVHSSMHHVCPHQELSSKIDITKVALRARESPYPMLEMTEAWKIVDEKMEQWKGSVEVIPIEESLGRVVAEPFFTKEPMPPFPASVKDGYACISADGAGVRRVRSALAAGDAPSAPLASGECARINTGAALPPGADCVVQVEDTKLVSASEDGRTEFEVEILVAPTPLLDVRPVGFDIPMGTALVERGDIMDAGSIGVLAGAGHQTVAVRTLPKVALLSTGNELQEPSEEELRPAHIRDSNRTMLRVLLREHGFTSTDCGIARDDPNELVNAVSSALRQADILLCTGGVSMGERDLLKPVLVNDFGATLHFGRVRMKPGKPATFATCQLEGRTKYIFALPGNPVSAYVCCLLFVIRALQVCSGLAAEWPRLSATLTHEAKLDARPEYARAALTKEGDEWKATLVGAQCSSRLLSACGATVLLELPGATHEVSSLPSGTPVSALLTGRLDRVKRRLVSRR